jgi:hypothetical protein
MLPSNKRRCIQYGFEREPDARRAGVEASGTATTNAPAVIPVRVQPVWLSGALPPRLGNVHSADEWEGVLKPVVARYQRKVSRLYFRADAGFANPEVYDYLESERIKYAIRLPANRILQERIGHLLTRPVGRPPNECSALSQISPIKREAGQRCVGWSPRSSGIPANFMRASVLS